jgi:membrane protein implicated in regulation of membrane protease activity
VNGLRHNIRIEGARAAPFERLAMQKLANGANGGSAFRGLAWIGGLAATLAAAGIAAFLALFAAATVVVIAVMSSVLLALAGLALRAKRLVRSRSAQNGSGAAGRDPGVIEARNVGGHSWVAYGWNERTR